MVWVSDRLSRARGRSKNTPPVRAVEAEGRELESRLGNDRLILLDERGRSLTSKGLAAKLADWQSGGEDVALVIGGPDGVAESVRSRANFVWSLSELTLPHGLARVLCAEQLYRAWTLSTGHPYHRQ